MNFLQLVIKQMRQRSLSTSLTLLSIVLGVSLAVSIMILRREGKNLFAQTDFGYDILVGPAKGSPLQLTLNTVYHLDQSPGVIPYSLYEDLSRKTAPPLGRPDYRPYVRIAVPFMVGDSFNGRRIIGTSPQMFGFDDAGKRVTGETFKYRKDHQYEFATGRAFAPRKFEAVVGSDVAAAFNLKLYDPKLSDNENLKRGGGVRATHGIVEEGAKNADVHQPRFRIVGILKPTHTANDRVVFVPFITLYAMAEHEEGMLGQAISRANPNAGNIGDVLRELGIDADNLSESMRTKLNLPRKPATAPADGSGELLRSTEPPPAAKKEDEHHDHEGHDHEHEHEHEEAYELDADGNIIPELPQQAWTLSAVLVQSRGPIQADRLMYNFRVIEDRATAVNPAGVMREFFDTFLSSSTTVLLLIAGFVSIVAAASIMTTIYNSVAARLREIAILRALGATRTRILTLICTEAVLLGLIGGIIGLVAGHLLSAAGSAYLSRTMGEKINWITVGGEEWLYLAGVVVLSFLAGLVPAAKAYKTPVATHLTSS